MIFSSILKRKATLGFAACLLLSVCFSFEADAQRVRLRSQANPVCTQVRATTGWKFADIFAEGNIAVQGGYGCNGAFIYDMTNPDAPILANVYNPGNNQQFLEAIVVGGRGYFGSGIGSGGVHIVDLSNPYSPVLLGTVDSTHGNGYNTIHEMMVVQQNGATYLIENSNATSDKPVRIIDVTLPSAPQFRSQFTAASNGWIHAMHIRGNRMYTSEFTGANVEIYDISNLASTSTLPKLGTIVSNTTNHSSWTSEDGRYLYSARETQDGDIRVYDVQNPAAPFLIRSIKAGDLNINAITPHNPVVMGNYLYVAWYQAGIQVFDLTDPTFPKRIGQYDTFFPAFAPTPEEQQALDNTDPWDMICGSPMGFSNSALPTSYNGNWAVYPFLGQNKVLAGDLTNGLIVLDASQIASPVKNKVSDYDGDRKTDLSVFTPSNSTWTIESSNSAVINTVVFGFSDDKMTPGDYDGDGTVDLAIYRPSTGTWWIRRSSNTSNFLAINFGLSADIPVPGDYDADGKTDVAVFRPSTGIWYIQQSTLGFKAMQWGVNGDKPVVGDFEGDGKADIAVWRPSNGVWYVSQSSSSIPLYRAFGLNGDRPVSADFDGNGASDFAVYRPSTGIWYMIDPITNVFKALNFGIAEDIPVPADYDGDSKADIAVFRPSSNVWYRLNSSDNSFYARVFGSSGDRPSPASVQP